MFLITLLMSSWLSPVFKFFLSAEWIVSDNFQCIYFTGLKYNSWTFYGSSQATVREESVRSVPRWILSAVVLKAIQHFDHITVFFCTNRNDLKNKKQSSVLTGTWIIIRTRNEKAFLFFRCLFLPHLRHLCELVLKDGRTTLFFYLFLLHFLILPFWVCSSSGLTSFLHSCALCLVNECNAIE